MSRTFNPIKPFNAISLVLLTAAILGFSSTAYASEEPPIRVALQTGGASAKVSATDGMELRELRNGVLLDVIDGASEISFSLKGDGIKASDGHTADAFEVYPKNGFLKFGGNKYRGAIRIIHESGALTVINNIPLEDYLRGVLPAEMPPGWGMEALKVQAVAARTYALNRMAVHASDSFDVYGTVADQAYSGLAGEDERADRAISETRGMVMTYDGEPIVAYYSASAGGCTSDPADYGEPDYPYLCSVYSPDDDCYAWDLEITASELAAVMKSAGTDVGTPKTICISKYAASGRVVEVCIAGSSGSGTIGAIELRRLIGYGRLKSTRFAIGKNGAFPPITVDKTSEPDKGKVVREALTRVLMKLGSGEFPVLTGDGIEEITLSLAVAIGSSGKSYLGGENIVVGYEVKEAEFTPAPSSEIATSVDFEPVKIGGSVYFKGVGYGHGKGMSQQGAKTFAEMGWDFEQILHHYYYKVDIVTLY